MDQIPWALIAACAGAIGGYYLKTFEMKQGELEARVTQTCTEIDTVEKLAVSYWKSSSSNETVAQEFEIVARLHRIAQLIAYCAERAYAFDDPKVEESLIEFRMAVTGDQFQVKERPIEPSRVAPVMRTATDLMIKVRGARRRWIG